MSLPRVRGQSVFVSPSLTLVIGAKFFGQISNTFLKGNKIHFKAFGVIFLHNKADKTYEGGYFHQKNNLYA
jgi:hypothetical protein